MLILVRSMPEQMNEQRNKQTRGETESLSKNEGGSLRELRAINCRMVRGSTAASALRPSSAHLYQSWLATYAPSRKFDNQTELIAGALVVMI